jgi:hypothetical protein
MKLFYLKYLSLFLAFQLHFSTAYTQHDVTLSGYIYDRKSGEALNSVTISCKELNKSTASNAYGFYSITLPKGIYEINFSLIGYQEYIRKFTFSDKFAENITLETQSKELSTVTIKSNNKLKTHTDGLQMGKIEIPMALLNKIPTFAGERDIIKVLQLMPGVKRGGEGGTGMFVRGGGADQNLVILDEATVYNAGHLLGFFSVFNSNSLKEVNLYKSAFPSVYGGRLSSILDIKMKEGNDKKFETQGSVGIIASNLTVEGPIIKNKASFIFSGRRTYLDQLLKLMGNPGGVQLPYYFYDLNGKVNYKISKRDRLYLSSYIGRDVLYTPKLGDGSDFDAKINTFLGNLTTTARWNHYYKTNKLFHNVTFITSQFRYNIEGKILDNSLLIKSSINDIGAKIDYDYHPNTAHYIRFGGMILNHAFRPNIVSTVGDISDILKSKQGAKIYTQEMGVYINDDHTVNDKLRFAYGLRISGTVTEKKLYSGLEPRLAAKYSITKNSSVKASYARMKQYLHLVSNASLSLPTDLWYPVTRNVKPSSSDQVSMGYYYSFQKQKTTLSVEGYYKWMNKLIEYKDGATLFLNDNYESELVSGKGDAYGAEFLLQKDEGKLSGWIAYTLSWSTRTFADLNNGKTYFSNYDRRHDVAVVANYEFTKRFSVSMAYVYSSGRPFTPRVSQFLMPNPSYSNIDILPIYTDRNAVRLHAAKRLDLDLCFKNKKKSKLKGEWHISAYNTFNRTQPQRIRITQDNKGGYKYQETGVFGLIVAVSYNFIF